MLEVRGPSSSPESPAEATPEALWNIRMQDLSSRSPDEPFSYRRRLKVLGYFEGPARIPRDGDFRRRFSGDPGTGKPEAAW